MDKILVVIDVQENFIEQCGAENTVPEIIKKIALRKKEGCEVVFTYDKSGGDFVKGVGELSGGCEIFKKHSYGCVRLVEYLKRRKPESIEFIGVCTDICVITNVLAAMTFLPFSDISVDANCCASETREGHKYALEIMKACNIGVENKENEL